MSERGSFVTSYIYCDRCLEVVKQTLLAKRGGLCSTQIPTWQQGGDALPIIAGKVGASYPGGELFEMEAIVGELSGKVCHDIRIAVLADEGEEIFTIKPNNGGAA